MEARKIGDVDKGLIGRATFWGAELADVERLIGEGYTRVELKMDGIWGRVEIHADRAEIWSRHGQLKAIWPVKPGHKFSGSSLIGEFMHGSAWGHEHDVNGHLFVFDCIQMRGRTLEADAQLARLTVAELVVKAVFVDSPISMVAGWNVKDASEVTAVWDEHVVARAYEGLVLKKPDAAFGDGWYRVKRTVDVDYVCMGFNASNAPKYVDMAVASIKGGLWIDGELVECVAAGGLSESHRKEFFENPEAYIGQVLRVGGYRIFPSGAVRHPNFLGWHLDKASEDCTLESALEAGGCLKAA